MGEHFLRWINIANFKCFHGFNAKGFARVNLVGGKNNVGKTAFLEACYVNVRAVNIKSFVGVLRDIKFMRENLNILADRKINDTKSFMERSSNLDIISSTNNAFFDIEEINGEKNYIFKFNKLEIKANSNNFSFTFEPMHNIDFIDSFGFANVQIIGNYSHVQKKDKEGLLNDVLKEFDDSISAFKVFDNLPQCKVNGEWLELTELGDGARHIVSIIAALFRCENGYLFIDEIENGTDYAYLEKIWDTILKLSKELNVQIFATTHSKECIEAYAAAAKKLADEDISFIRLSKLKDGQIKASTLDFALLQNNIEQGREVRGW